MVNPDHLVSPEVQELRVIWVVLDLKVAKVCKVLVERLANLVYPVNLALLARLVKTAFPATKVAKERWVLLALLVSLALVVHLDLLEVPALPVLKAIPASLELQESRVNRV